MDNLFTYLSFRKDDPPDHFVVEHFVAAWGIMSCITFRCLEPSFQFMHDHDDLQWLSHGACMVTSSYCMVKQGQSTMERDTCTTRGTSHVITQIISENISLSYGRIFQASETLQRSLIQTATLHKHLQFTISMPDIHNSTRRDDTEEQDIPLFPEFIN